MSTQETIESGDLAPPSLRIRLLALLLDYLVILGWMAVLALASVTYYLLRGNLPDYFALLGPYGSQAAAFGALTLPVVIYHFATEAGRRHATWGKRRLGLTVRAVDGSAPSRKQVLLRTVIKFLPWEAAHFFIWQTQWRLSQTGGDGTVPWWASAGLAVTSIAPLAYVASVARTRLRRGPHDLLAGTRVVTTPPPPGNRAAVASAAAGKVSQVPGFAGSGGAPRTL